MESTATDWILAEVAGENNIYVEKLAVGLASDYNTEVHNVCGPLLDAHGKACVRVHARTDGNEDSDSDNSDNGNSDNGNSDNGNSDSDNDDDDNDDDDNDTTDSNYDGNDVSIPDGGQAGSNYAALSLDFSDVSLDMTMRVAENIHTTATILGPSCLGLLVEFTCLDCVRRVMIPIFNLYMPELDVIQHVSFITPTRVMFVNSGFIHKVDWLS